MSPEPQTIGMTLSALLAEWEAPPERHPVTRSGERAPIVWLVRASIYSRDHGRCRRCRSEANLELDHIIPWSAGGSDDTTNLRTFCQPCNTRRSNYRDRSWEDRGIWPTTWWCFHCWRDPDIQIDDPDILEWDEPRSRFHTVWKDGTNLAAAPFVREPAEHVYCASCQTYSYSDLLLTGQMLSMLVERCAPPDQLEPRGATA